jgi:hypothetical protein
MRRTSPASLAIYVVPRVMRNKKGFDLIHHIDRRYWVNNHIDKPVARAPAKNGEDATC